MMWITDDFTVKHLRQLEQEQGLSVLFVPAVMARVRVESNGHTVGHRARRVNLKIVARKILQTI